MFACLSDNGGINSQIEPLSAEVLAYEETITKYAEQFDIKEYVSIIQAIMMQESGGKENDPMQSSERGFNTKYPRIPNGITNAEYSIEVGIQTFADCLTRAKVDGPSNTEKLYLAFCRDIIMAVVILNGQLSTLADTQKLRKIILG